jgi:hypothetical protein
MNKNQTHGDTPRITIRELEKEYLPHVKTIFREFVRYHENRDGILQKIEAA